MPTATRFDRVDFHRFKAFRRFTLHLRAFNILVGPNNAGKSTVLAAFRILAAAMRRATSRKAVLVPSPDGKTYGHAVDLQAISVAEENIFFDYDDSQPAVVRFRLSNGHELTLYFPEQGACYLIPDSKSRSSQTPSSFRENFNCPIGFVPILGPVEHNEQLFEKEAARLALFSYRAARNFRNIWHHFPERFDDFRSLLRETWPGMDIQPPTIDRTHDKPRLYMFCPEERIPRELFWAGFGFQVWCQMLTHVIQSRDASLFLIDEPDIYLHSDLQRQLIGLLRNLGPDILLATHSTEIISEAETDDIVLINKRRKSARRISQPAQLQDVFSTLGSNLNPTLTQLAKTRKVVFVEGRDFQLLARIARKLGFARIANRSNFAIIPVEGFNPERARNIKAGIETTLGGKVATAIVLDRDYRSDVELKETETICAEFADLVRLLRVKEIENFLLVPAAIDRAAALRLAERNKRTGAEIKFANCAAEILAKYAISRKAYVTSQYVASRRRFERIHSPGHAEETVVERVLCELEHLWLSPLDLISGKDALTEINVELQSRFGISVTHTSILDSMSTDQLPINLTDLLQDLESFAARDRGARLLT